MFNVVVIKSAEKELDKLPIHLQAETLNAISALSYAEIDDLREPLIRNIRDGLKELRVSSKDGISRSFFFFDSGEQIYIVHILQKKTQKTPKQAIALALQRMKILQKGQQND